MKKQALASGSRIVPRAVASSRAGAQSEPRVLISGATFAAAALALIACTATFLIPPDYDYWWHLADGRYIVTHHALPAPDVFSFTATGRPLVVHEWLTEVPMYLLHHAFGIRGPLALFALGAVAVVLLTFSTLRRLQLRAGAAFGLTFVMLAAIWLFTGPRPQVAGFALTAAEIWLLERWIAGHDRSIWALPPLIWLWGNLHGSFEIGLALPALILAGEVVASWLNWKSAIRLPTRARLRLAAATAVSLALLPVNPNGLPLLIYPLAKLHDPLARQFIAEWMPADISNPIFWPFALLAGGYVMLLAVRRPQIPASDLLIAMALIGASLATRKYVPFAAICLAAPIGRVLAQPNRGDAETPIFIARLSAGRRPRTSGYAPPTIRTQILFLVELIALVCVLVLFVRATDPMTAVRRQQPVAAIDALGAAGIGGPLFNDYNWGGYLIWRLWPQTRVFIDGRGDMYIRGGELRQYMDVVQLQANAGAVLDQYQIRTVLFQKDTPLIRYLLDTGRWRAAYDDGRVVVLKRSGNDAR